MRRGAARRRDRGGRQLARQARATHLVVHLVRGAAHERCSGRRGTEITTGTRNRFGRRNTSAEVRNKSDRISRDSSARPGCRARPTSHRGLVAVVGSLGADGLGPPMRMSALFLRTLRDDPADAEVDSHRLLVRAGLHPPGRVRASTRGCRSATGCCARSSRSSARRWTGPAPRRCSCRSPSRSSSGSAAAATRPTGRLMFRLQDRKETGYCLSPTAEEVVTTHRRAGVRLVPRPAGEPVPDQLEVPRRAAAALRAAARPRVPDEGRVLVRPRPRRAAASATSAMYDAYHRVFERCGLTFRPVEGAVGRDRRRRRTTSSWPSPRSARTTSCGARAATTPPTSRPRDAGAARRAAAPADVAADGEGAHARPAGHRRASPKLLGVEPTGC